MQCGSNSSLQQQAKTKSKPRRARKQIRSAKAAELASTPTADTATPPVLWNRHPNRQAADPDMQLGGLSMFEKSQTGSKSTRKLHTRKVVVSLEDGIQALQIA